MFLESDDLGDHDLGIFTLLRQAFHHRTEQRLREPCGAVQRLLDRELPQPFRSLDLSPKFVKEHVSHP